LALLTKDTVQNGGGVVAIMTSSSADIEIYQGGGGETTINNSVFADIEYTIVCCVVSSLY
jgi:hypothetical protein